MVGWRGAWEHQLPWDMASFPNFSKPEEEGSVQPKESQWEKQEPMFGHAAGGRGIDPKDSLGALVDSAHYAAW